MWGRIYTFTFHSLAQQNFHAHRYFSQSARTLVCPPRLLSLEREGLLDLQFKSSYYRNSKNKANPVSFFLITM